MRNLLALAGAVALATLSTSAMADEAAPAAAVAKVGRLVVSSDGKRIGRIDKVEANRVGIIFESAYIYVPTESLSAGENNRVVTALTFKDATHR